MPDTTLAATKAVDSAIEFLRLHGEGCRFARGNITGPAKRLANGDLPPVPTRDDVAAIKIEKNAIALMLIPAIFDEALPILDGPADRMFWIDASGLQSIDAATARTALDPGRTPGGLCQLIYRSMSNVFLYAVEKHLADLRASGDPAVNALLARYVKVLNIYHTHTNVAVEFTPTLHITAGIHTALFFILRTLSAVEVLGRKRFGRALEPWEIEAAAKLNGPLLMAVSRCHLEQMLELEVLLGKGEDQFMTRLDVAGYEAAIERMFQLAPDGSLQLELTEGVMAAMPRELASSKPHTGCPGLFAATDDAENAVATLIRYVARAYAAMM
jgi:hypothetical protein